ncbi:hypothetical protein BASA81_018250 [Batrachochytrium salamandrivorans]|nr:hypothetical protein BASA81_018250 [Batrachochytrium salamandrivorans]
MNYLISGTDSSFNREFNELDLYSLSVRIGDRFDANGDHVKFTQSMAGTYAIVTLTDSSTGSDEVELYTVCEYRSKISIDSEGNYYKDISGLSALPQV